jgi:hypothetical protein
VAQFNTSSARITGILPMLTPPKLRELRHDNWVADNEVITAATGWKATVGLPDGLKQLNISPL